MSSDSLNRALERWSLHTPSPVAETATSHIFRVVRGNGLVAALKLLKPQANGDEARGGALLAWYAGHGAADVYAMDDDAVLLRWLGGGTLGDLARSGHDAMATGIFCDVAEKLHAPRLGALPELTPLRQRFDGLFTTRRILWPRPAAELLPRAIGIAYRQLDSDIAPIPLHGDLHHDNILRDGEAWYVIDPKGLIGDPAYDYANSFLNPERADAMVIDAVRIARHVTAIAERTGIARKHLLAWAVSHAALSGAWDIEDGNPPSQQAAMLPLLLSAYEAA